MSFRNVLGLRSICRFLLKYIAEEIAIRVPDRRNVAVQPYVPRHLDCNFLSYAHAPAPVVPTLLRRTRVGFMPNIRVSHFWNIATKGLGNPTGGVFGKTLVSNSTMGITQNPEPNKWRMFECVLRNESPKPTSAFLRPFGNRLKASRFIKLVLSFEICSRQHSSHLGRRENSNGWRSFWSWLFETPSGPHGLPIDPYLHKL